MKNILFALIIMMTILIANFNIIKAIKTRNKKPTYFFGKDGLIALWITTTVFLIFAFIGWFSAPNIKYEIIKNISFILLFVASALTIYYTKYFKK